MKPRWNIDVLRGLLLALTFHSTWQGIGVLRATVFAYQPSQFWTGLVIVAVFGFCSFAFLCPTRPRLQATFVLTTVAAIVPLLTLFYWLRNHPRDEFHLAFRFCFAQVLNIATAVGAWLAYRAEPRKA